MDRKEFLKKLDHFINDVLNNVIEQKEENVKEQNRKAQERYAAKIVRTATVPMRKKRR